MLNRRLSVVLSGVLSAVLLGVSVSLIQAATLPVTITQTGFVPATLKIMAGDTIEFRNSTTATQSARTSVATGFNTGDIGPNQTKSVTVATPGTYSYSSAYTTSLTGSVEVASASGTTATSSALTSQPATTQAQPVSGVFEVVMAMMTTGVAMVIGGVLWQRHMLMATAESAGHEVTLVQVPRLTLQSRSDDDTL